MYYSRYLAVIFTADVPCDQPIVSGLRMIYFLFSFLLCDFSQLRFCAGHPGNGNSAKSSPSVPASSVYYLFQNLAALSLDVGNGTTVWIQ
jgi:hypothetical protein